MKKITKIQGLIYILLVALFIYIRCDIFEPREAKFEIISTSKDMFSYDCPVINITAKNVGDATGYDLTCDVIAIKEGSAIDTGFAFFGFGVYIFPGESITDKAIFFDLTSHDEYDTLEYYLDWSSKKLY